MRHITLLVLAAVLVPAALAVSAPTTCPSKKISNGTVSVWMYLPDANDGYYRGRRFDWSGLVNRVTYKNHVFFAPWKNTHDPTFHEDVDGPAAEFSMQSPPGFAQAKAGETFIKIGIGKLRKKAEPQYSFRETYDIAEAPPWKIDSGEDWVQFDQKLEDDRGWGYEYSKRIQILKNEPGFEMVHRLKNTGTLAIDTTYYNHNFTMIDDQPIGSAYRLVFPFAPRTIEGRLDAPARLDGRELRFDGDLAAGQSLWVAFEGQKNAADNAVTIRNDKTAAAIQISGDETPLRCAFYSTRLCVCPEMFIPVKIAPGAEKTWTIRYSLQVNR